METSYLKLMTAAPRAVSYMRLEMDEGVQPVQGKNYLYLEIPVRGVETEDQQGVTLEVKRNQHVWIAAAAHVNVHDRQFIEVEPNAALAEYGQVQPLYRLHPGSGRKQLGFWFTARKDTDLSKFDYAVRVYMPA